MGTNGSGGSYWARWQLGARLRQLREAAGKTLLDVAEAQIASTSKMYRIETGKIAVKPADIYALASIYSLSNEVTDVLIMQAKATRDEGWFEEYADALPEWMASYAGMEGAAARLRAHHPDLVWGAIQTADYARAMIRTDPSLDDKTVDARVAFRMERQKTVLTTTRSGHVRVVLGAGALTLVVGSPDVMAAQIRHLQMLNAQNMAEVRVLPWSTGPHMDMNGPFTIMDFDDPENPAVIHVESYIGSRYIETPAQLRRFDGLFDGLTKKSVTIEEYMHHEQ